MTPRDGDRGISPILGAILLAGILVMLISVLQINAVPHWNTQVEFAHNERVQNDLMQLRGAIVATGADGNRRSASVPLGVSYPTRMLLQNPPDSTGTLRTAPARTVVVHNATASGETGDYWTGEPVAYDTRALVYAPDYNYYDDAPTTVYESGVLFNRHVSADVTLTSSPFVEGNRVAFVLVAGNLSATGSDTAVVETTPVSAAARAITVTNATHNLTVSIPTRLSASTWRELLGDEIDPDGIDGDDRYVLDVSAVPGGDRVNVTLQRGVTYELRMATVGVGNGLGSVAPAYLVAVTGDDETTEPGESVDLVVEVRDRYNNPVSNVVVNASVVSGGGSVSPDTATTGSDGRATFAFTATAPTTATVEANISATPTPRESATFVVEVGTTGGGGGVSTAGPVTTDVRASPDTVGHGGTVGLAANVSDLGRGGLQIVGAEWYRNTTGDPGEGSANPMTPVDGTFDTVEEAVEDGIDTAGWSPGTYTLSVRGRDANGAWGPVSTTQVTVDANASPTFGGLVVDDTSSPFVAEFGVDYAIDDPDDRFENVTVTFENLDTGASETQSSTSEGGAGDEIAYSGPFGTNGDTYEITVRIYDVDGSVVGTEVHTESADGSGTTTLV